MRVFFGELLIFLVMVLVAPIPLSWADGMGDKPVSRESDGIVWPETTAQAGERDSTRPDGDVENGAKKASARGKTKSADGDKVWRSEDLEILGIGMGVGDLDGDGNNEIVIISPSTVYVYRVAQARLDLVAEYAAGSLELKSVDVAKIRKQGPCRIYVTAQNRGTVSSFVLELRNRVLEPVIQDVRFYLRVINYPTRGPILLGQRKGMNRTFEGAVFRVNDKGTELEEAGRFGVPLKIPIFGFAIGDLEGKRTPLIAVFDKEDHLRVYDPQGKRMYVSKDFYGGSDIVLRSSGPEERKEAEKGLGESDKAFFRPRILSMDLENRSAYDVLVASHSSKTMRYLSRTKMLEEGKICVLGWNGDTLVERWRSPDLQGMITDFAVDFLPGMAGRRLIVLERKKTDWFSFIRSKTQVKAYDLDALIAGGGERETERK
jgi:hypothetical protein